MSSFRTWQVGGSPGAVQERLDVCFYSSDERSVEGPVCCRNSLSWPVSLTAHIVCCTGRGYCDWQERDYEIHTPQRDWGKTVLRDAIPVRVFLYTSNFPFYFSTPSPLPSALRTKNQPTKFCYVNFILMCVLRIF